MSSQPDNSSHQPSTAQLHAFLAQLGAPMTGEHERAVDVLASSQSVFISAMPGTGARQLAATAIYATVGESHRVVWVADSMSQAMHRRRQLTEMFPAVKVGVAIDGHEVAPDAPIVVTVITNVRSRMQRYPDRWAQLKLVVLDGVHHMADRGTGTAWEETVMALAGPFRMIAIARHLSNAQDCVEWLGDFGRNWSLIELADRPVPLQHWVLVADALLPLYEDAAEPGDDAEFFQAPAAESGEPSAAESTGAGTDQFHVTQVVTDAGGGDDSTRSPGVLAHTSPGSEKAAVSPMDVAKRGREKQQQTSQAARKQLQSEIAQKSRAELFDDLLQLARNGNVRPAFDRWGPHRPKGQKVPPVVFGQRALTSGAQTPYHRQLQLLADQAMLPAVVVVAGKLRCDQIAESCVAHGICLTSPDEAAAISRIVAASIAHIPAHDIDELRISGVKKQLLRGFAPFHSDVLPLVRRIVEELFTRGLLKAVFTAAEPDTVFSPQARTVVLSTMRHTTPATDSLMTADRWEELTSRAGRAGIDTAGHAVVVPDDSVDAEQLIKLTHGSVPKLSSALQPTAAMAARLIHEYGYEEARRLLLHSFGERRHRLQLKDYEATKQQLQHTLSLLVDAMAEHSATADTPIASSDATAHPAAAERNGHTSTDSHLHSTNDPLSAKQSASTGNPAVGSNKAAPASSTAPAELAAFLQAPTANRVDAVINYGRLHLKRGQEEDIVNEQAMRRNEDSVRQRLAELRHGQVIALRHRRGHTLAVVVNDGERADAHRGVHIYLGTGADRWLTPGSLAYPPEIVGRLHLEVRPATFRGRMKAKRAGNRRNRRRRITGLHMPDYRSQVIAGLARHTFSIPDTVDPIPTDPALEALDNTIATHIVSHHPNEALLRQLAIRYVQSRHRLDQLDDEFAVRQLALSAQFTEVCTELAARGYLTSPPPQPAEQYDHPTAVQQLPGSQTIQLTTAGELLATITGPWSLVASECLRRGLWDNLNPAELAGVASMCTGFIGQGGHATEPPTRAMTYAMTATRMTWMDIGHPHGIPVDHISPDEPDERATGALYLWADGASFATIRTILHTQNISLSPGEFVQWAARTADLLTAIAAYPERPVIAETAQLAATAIRRGIVTWGN
ncbi:hypothetical protein ACFPVT_05685 [Corynebacterium choanae]|uniref:Ski2-like helicase n=1 Tax=Corynebacterium choanae TaxID=1862358 RepID=A0A3G6J6I8_9CORY|nr:hypothetical protein [Corynebacterium choanae]AZA13559.1 ski2-like helicase [Corynebacterium choanae]